MATKFTIHNPHDDITGTVSGNLEFTSNGRRMFGAGNVVSIEETGRVASSGRLGKGLAYGAVGALTGGAALGLLAGTVAGANSGTDVTCNVMLDNGKMCIVTMDEVIYQTLRIRAARNEVNEFTPIKATVYPLKWWARWWARGVWWMFIFLIVLAGLAIAGTSAGWSIVGGFGTALIATGFIKQWGTIKNV